MNDLIRFFSSFFIIFSIIMSIFVIVSYFFGNDKIVFSETFFKDYKCIDREIFIDGKYIEYSCKLKKWREKNGV